MADPQTTRANSPSGNDDLREQLNTLKSDLSDLSQTVRKQAKDGLDQAQDAAAAKVDDLEAQIRKNPVTATAIAAGVGFLIGAILSR